MRWVAGIVGLSLWIAHAQPTVEEALRLIGAGRPAEAEKILLGLEKARPGDPEVQYRLGLVLLRNGKPAAARPRLEAAAKLAPEPVVWLALAQARLRLEDLPGALAAAGRARSSPSAQPELARAATLFDAEVIKYHLRKGHAQQALDLAKKGVAGSDLPVFHNLLGKAYELNRDAASAAAELQQAVRLEPNQAGYYFDLAQLFLDHNMLEPAELVMLEAVRRFPDNAEALRLLGLARYGLGKNEEALDSFLKAIDAAPDSETAYASLETLLPSAGPRIAEIIPRLRRLAGTNPGSPLGPYLLALVVPEESEELLRKAIGAAPDFWPAWFELHKPLKAREKWEEAAAALRKTITLKKDYAPAHYALAEYYMRTGDRAGAARERELHHKLLAAQRAADEKRRADAPRLPYTLSER
jgi:tetratricopeptide (TPR) repeat protein